MNLPILLINFKTYIQGQGENALRIAKICENIINEYGVNIGIAPQLLDTIWLAKLTSVPIFSQHIDPNPSGSATGHIDPATLLDNSITGTLLNHSERRLEISALEDSINIARRYKLKTVVCAGTIKLSKAISVLEPWAVAMEPPELIGGNVSVTTKPDIVKKAVEAIKLGNKAAIPLVGAGVKNSDHMNTALKLGANGVLLASGIVKSDKPQQIIENMAKIMINY